jgi:hypothetical protein
MTADDPRPVPPAPLHPDIDTLADFDAGVLDDATAERVAAHVRSCAVCTDALRAMAAVQNDLRALPTPPMPAAVAARLQDVLGDLRRGEQTGPAVPPPSDRPGPEAEAGRPGVRPSIGPPAPVSDLADARQRRRRRLSRVAGAAAAAVAVLAAAGSVTALYRAAGDSQEDSAAAGNGTTAEQAPAPADGLDTLGVPSYSKESLRSALPQIEQQSAVDVITGRGDTGPAGAMADTARRTACVGTIRGSSGRLQAVRRIMYEGRMAYVFVFSDDGRRTAYVVSDDCGTSPALPASVLDTVS